MGRCTTKYFSRASELYQSWGAFTKADQLSTTFVSSADSLDLTTSGVKGHSRSQRSMSDKHKAVCHTMFGIEAFG